MPSLPLRDVTSPAEGGGSRSREAADAARRHADAARGGDLLMAAVGGEVPAVCSCPLVLKVRLAP